MSAPLEITSTDIYKLTSYNPFFLNTFLLMPSALLFLPMALNPIMALVLPYYDKTTASI